MPNYTRRKRQKGTALDFGVSFEGLKIERLRFEIKLIMNCSVQVLRKMRQNELLTARCYDMPAEQTNRLPSRNLMQMHGRSDTVAK